MTRRKIVRIDEEKCDGCAQCVPACAEGAIRIVDGKARLVSDIYCDGLGECLSECPQDAISVIEREAQPFDEQAVQERLAASSRLGNWPVQLQLVRPGAPFLQGADLLLVADCVPFAMADFHTRLLRERPLLIACPKLDDPKGHVEKLAAILLGSDVNSLTVVRMEVPCCSGLVRIAQNALRESGSDITLKEVLVSIRGSVLQGKR